MDPNKSIQKAKANIKYGNKLLKYVAGDFNRANITPF